MTTVASNGSGGYPAVGNGGYTAEDEDGFFTCAVSVQHKKHDTETGSNYSADETGRRVVWPANQPRLVKQTIETNKTFANTFKQAQEQADQPHRWIHKAGEEEPRQALNRVSRSNSRSKNIMDRARSFERSGAADSRGNSRPASRAGSFRHRSPSGSRSNVDEMWFQQIDRPSSRTDVDSRRFGEIGRVNTLDWEERIHGSVENIPPKTPPPKRKEMNMARQLYEEERALATKTPEPPPPPVRAAHTLRDDYQMFPPPPSTSDSRSKLSEESVNQLSEGDKETIVKQWVEATSHSTGDITRELERFAYDIAESVVSTMEKNSERKETWTQETEPNQTASLDQGEYMSSGIFHAVPAHSSGELHGPVYIQDQRRVGMTFQQEERRRQELMRQEEARQEQNRRAQMEAEERRRQEAERRAIEEQKRQEAEIRAAEERRRQEAEMRAAEERRRQEEERLRMEEMKRKEEERRRQEQEAQRQEAERKRAAEQKRREAEEQEKKRQEILRYEKLRQEEEAMRQEEIRLEQEMRRKYELQQQKLLEEQQLQEQQLRMQQEQQLRIQQEQQLRMQQEQQRLQQEQQMRMQQEQQRITEMESMQKQKSSQDVRAHIPKLSKTKSFDHSQDRSNDAQRGDEHLGKVRTGQVHDKRNFWIRSTSADRTGNPTLSPAPRRRRLDGWNGRQKENEDPESRPGSSLGQANLGLVQNLTTGFISKSKSSAAVMQEEERGRPRQRAVKENLWTKEKYDQQTNQNFLKSQEVKTNKVNETITSWGKHEQPASGRTTPVPSRNIGHTFAENKVAKAENEKSANSWRTKTPEPSVKLVNVSVEKAVGSTQNIHISENAHAQIANFMQENKVITVSQKQEFVSTTNSITSQSMSSSLTSGSGTQPPPTPERNQSFGGKCPDTKPELEPTKNEPKPCNETKSNSVQTKGTEVYANQESCVQSYSNKFASEKSVFRQDRSQSTVNHLQSSTSAHSINSIVSTCSSGALPVPVKNSWFDELESVSVASSVPPDGVLSPTGTGRTPVPVVAHWFTHSDFDRGAEKSDIVKPPREEFKPNVSDEMDTRSVKSDSTVIENKPEETKQPQPVVSQPVSDTDTSGVISVPQSPSLIRKKFQQNASFEKSFQKSAEFELSKEFREGVRGKVRESRESFLKRSNSEKLIEAKEIRELELQSVKLSRSDSRTFEDSSKEKSEQMKQEKLRELEAVKRSRSRSKVPEEAASDRTVTQERLERDTELASLAHRRVEAVEEAALFSPTELKEIQLREERERELAELSRRHNLVDPESSSALKEQELKAERARELIALADRNLDFDRDKTSREEMLRQERSEELRQIAQLRANCTNDEDSLYLDRDEVTGTPELEPEEVRGRVRGTAALWQQRDQSSSRDRSSSCTTPTRRIGGMFRRDPEYWGDDEDLPAPPPTETSVPTLEDGFNPPPPPRQSSRGKVEEYRHWGGGRRGAAPHTRH